MRGACLAVALAVVGGGALAHPHQYFDQQVALTLGTKRADISVVIIPSVDGAASLVSDLDADQDGQLSQPEANAFANDLLAGLSLMVDGAAVILPTPMLTLPPVEALSTGAAGIRLDVGVDLVLAERQDHSVTLAVAYDRYDHDWFIQPYLKPDFAALMGQVAITRSAAGDRATVEFRSKQP